MTTVAVAVLVFLVLAAITALVGDQALGEAKRLSLFLIRRATTRLPQTARDELRAELIAEVEYLFAEHQPLRGLFEALRFAIGVRFSREGLEAEYGRTTEDPSPRTVARTPELTIEVVTKLGTNRHSVTVTNTTKKTIVEPRVPVALLDGTTYTVPLRTALRPGEIYRFSVVSSVPPGPQIAN